MPTGSSTQPSAVIRPRPSHLIVPDYGVGAGLRIPHYRHVLTEEPTVGFFEVISENFFDKGGKPLYHLDRFCERYKMILHGVSLSIGAPEEPSSEYLSKLKHLVRRVKPAWVSDHFCYCGASGAHLHDLLPLPYTEEAIKRVVRRARRIQDFLEVPFGLENTSSYLTYRSSTMTEWEFVSRIVEEADCGLMFDVNNLYVSAYNHGYDPLDFLARLPVERILQIHVAGHTHMGDYIIDTHVGPLLDEVLSLYRETIRRAGPVSTLLEWDDEIPEFAVLEHEIQRIAAAREQGLAPSCPPLQGAIIDRQLGQPGQPLRGWTQGGPTDWPREAQQDELPAERARKGEAMG